MNYALPGCVHGSGWVSFFTKRVRRFSEGGREGNALVIGYCRVLRPQEKHANTHKHTKQLCSTYRTVRYIIPTFFSLCVDRILYRYICR